MAVDPDGDREALRHQPEYREPDLEPAGVVLCYRHRLWAEAVMTNDELAKALATTQDRLRMVGTAYAEHPILVEHLTALLAEQLKRATSNDGDVK